LEVHHYALKSKDLRANFSSKELKSSNGRAKCRKPKAEIWTRLKQCLIEEAVKRNFFTIQIRGFEKSKKIT
jgi:hypothetical protein